MDTQEIRAEGRNMPSIVLAVSTFLLPFFFIPSSLIPFAMGKGLLLILCSAALAITWLVTMFRKGAATAPRSWMFPTTLILIVSAGISALLSGAPRIALIGQFDVGTVVVLASLFILLFVGSTTIQNSKQRSYIYAALLSSILVTIVFQATHLIVGPESFNFGVLLSSVSNVVGKWNDLAIFIGVGLLILLLSIELLPLAKLMRWFLWAIVLVLLFFLLLIGFQMGWYVLGAMAILYFVYRMSTSDTKKYVSIPALILFAVSLVVVLGGNIVGDTVADSLGTTQIEIRPSLSATTEVTREVLKENVMFGSGPNRFDSVWRHYKPTEINQTRFWSVPFRDGISSLASTFSTLGVVGFLAWAVFLVLALTAAVRLLFLSFNSMLSKYFGISLSFLSFYLWTFFIFYIPNIVILFLSVLITALVLGMLVEHGGLRTWDYNFMENPKPRFIVTLSTVVIAVLIVVVGYVSLVRFGSFVVYAQAVKNINETGNINEGESSLLKAIRWYESDQYYRSLIGIQTGQISNLFNQAGVSPEVIRSQFQTTAGSAIANAQRAINLDPRNYVNWTVLGRLYEQLVPLGIEGSYESAQTAYTRARAENPSGPDVVLLQARLEATRGDTVAAKGLIQESLTLKPNYIDAAFLLSQIQVAEGNIIEAINSVESAISVSPENSLLYFQLGLLYYNNQNFERAVSSFESAVIFNPVYANAKYFLGLSYYEIEETEDAIDQFEDVLTLNPGNQEVLFILKNLKVGNAPFADVQPPLDDEPENRDELPVEEKPTVDETITNTPE